MSVMETRNSRGEIEDEVDGEVEMPTDNLVRPREDLYESEWSGEKTSKDVPNSACLICILVAVVLFVVFYCYLGSNLGLPIQTNISSSEPQFEYHRKCEILKESLPVVKDSDPFELLYIDPKDERILDEYTIGELITMIFRHSEYKLESVDEAKDRLRLFVHHSIKGKLDEEAYLDLMGVLSTCSDESKNTIMGTPEPDITWNFVVLLNEHTPKLAQRIAAHFTTILNNPPKVCITSQFDDFNLKIDNNRLTGGQKLWNYTLGQLFKRYPPPRPTITKTKHCDVKISKHAKTLVKSELYFFGRVCWGGHHVVMLHDPSRRDVNENIIVHAVKDKVKVNMSKPNRLCKTLKFFELKDELDLGQIVKWCQKMCNRSNRNNGERKRRDPVFDDWSCLKFCDEFKKKFEKNDSQNRGDGVC